MNLRQEDISSMKWALELAERGRGAVSPNPLVGCVITDSEGTIIGEGWHERYGEAHAEANAIADCKRRGNTTANAIVYVTLEPCAHNGKTGPCADLLIKEKIAKCVIAIRDPYIEVNGKGIEKLQAAGIEVEVGVLADEATEQNKFFLKHSIRGLPYITLKIASSLDGKVALRSGASKYISSEASRKMVHTMRSHYDAVLVASATVIADNPELTVRLSEGRSPKRIVLDASLRVEPTAKIFSDEHPELTIVVATESAVNDKKEKAAVLRSRGITIIPIATKTAQLDLYEVFAELGKQDISSILIEAGPTLATTIFQQGHFDEFVLFLAPILLGNDARSSIGELHLRSLTDASRFRLFESYNVDGSDDLYINFRKTA